MLVSLRVSSWAPDLEPSLPSRGRGRLSEQRLSPRQRQLPSPCWSLGYFHDAAISPDVGLLAGRPSFPLAHLSIPGMQPRVWQITGIAERPLKLDGSVLRGPTGCSDTFSQGSVIHTPEDTPDPRTLPVAPSPTAALGRQVGTQGCNASWRLGAARAPNT